MLYTDVFTGSNVYPSELSYSAVALSSDIYLSWPTETSTAENLAARIMDITPDAAGYSIYLPDALNSGTGNTILFSNRGAYTFIVKDADGTQVVTIAAGELWQVYLSDNSTSAGVWHILEYGATTSTANASSLAGTGIVAVGTLLSQSVPITEFNSSYTAGATDRAKMYNWTGAGGTLTLPLPVTVGNNWFIYLRNSGSGTLVADAPGTTLINGASYVNFSPGDSAIIASDGTSLYTIGFGQSAAYAFTFTSVNVAGTGDYTLSGTELNQTAYKFTGALTGNRNVIVPSTVQQYWVDNETSGAYSLTVKTAGYTGVTVVQGARAILYCDGTRVVSAETGGIALPLAVTDGGTGATTAGAALINLGGTAVGTAIFTAAAEADAWTALGPAQSGNVDGGSF